MGSAPRSRPELRPYLVVLAVFVVSRVIAWAVGLRFDGSPLDDFWQLADPELLRSDPWRTLVYLHAQPPLFNAAVALTLRTPWPFGVWQVVLWLCGAVVAVGTLRLLRVVGVGPVAASTLAAVVILRPGFLLLETWLLYDLPVVALLVLAAVALDRGLADERNAAAPHLFFACLATLVLTRSFFHPLVLPLALAWVAFALRGRLAKGRSTRRWVAASIVPLLLVAGWTAKNVWVFDQLQGSSWLGMNLARVVRAGLDDAELDVLVEQGVVSDLLRSEPFHRRVATPASSPLDGRFDGIETLQRERKSTGSVNYHHLDWIETGAAYRRDASAALRARPGAYAEGVAKAWFYFLQPLGTELHLQRRLDKGPGAFASAENAVRTVLGPWTLELAGKPRTVYLVLLLAIPAACAAGGWLLWHTWRSRRAAKTGIDARRRLALVGFLFGTCVYVAVVGTLFEVGENQRFRAYVDPFLVVLVAGAVSSALDRARSRQATPSTRKSTDTSPS